MNVKIVTDTTADISAEVAQALGVTIVPGYVHFGKEVFRDGVDISNEAFYRKLIASPFHPTTSAPTPEDFVRVYSDCSQEVEGIISIHVSSKISDTYNSAMKARKKVKGKCQVEVVDSRFVSVGLSLVVMEAAKLANAGESIPDICEKINEDISRICMLVVLDTMKYAGLGKRVVKLTASLARRLDIKPLLVFKNGEIMQESLVHTNSYPRIIDRLCDFVWERAAIQELAIAHSAVPEQAEELKKRLVSVLPEERIHIAQIGSAIGVHSGPGALVIALRQGTA
ncbi:DegV family protein [Chloroflexota bacterium]